MCSIKFLRPVKFFVPFSLKLVAFASLKNHRKTMENFPRSLKYYAKYWIIVTFLERICLRMAFFCLAFLAIIEEKSTHVGFFSVLFLVTYTFWPMRQQGRALKGTRGAGIQAELVVRRLHCTLPYTAPA